jgi:hypothetical protein
VLLLCGAFIAAGLTLAAAPGKFRVDDPLAHEPDTRDASSVKPWEIDLFIDLAVNLFGQPGEPVTGVRAANVNTIDEVPDSSWFTNRIVARPVSIEEVVRGSQAGSGPVRGRWTVIGAKEVGFAPGFTMQDAAGETWFVSLDARGYPEAATGAILVANKIFWTLGYWQTDNVLIHVAPDRLDIGDTATYRPMSGQRRRMRQDDLDEVWRRAEPSRDGSYRAVASRQLTGKPLGGFRYYGTRPDDPNDVVPHEHRRELRALKVFGAWTNLVDMKAGNTLDMLVSDNGRSIVRHYLQDVGSTFGAGANGPREFDEGWEHLFEGDLVWKRLATLGFFIRPWQTVPYEDIPAIGRFEGTEFEPSTWKTRVPVAALRHAQSDDLFWAARRVAAFSDEMIKAMVKTAEYSDPKAAQHLADVLIQRRDKIASAYLVAVNPVVNVALSPDGELSFDNAAVNAGVAAAPKGGYHVSWSRFDNATNGAAPLGAMTIAPGEPPPALSTLPTAVGSFVRVSIRAVAPPNPTWGLPVHAYFRRAEDRWMLVGLERSKTTS